MPERMLPIPRRKWSQTDHDGPVIFADLETDSLVPDQLFLAVTKDENRGSVAWYRPEEWPKFLEYLNTASVLVFHNAVGFDLPVLYRLFGWTPGDHVCVRDTLVMSRLQYADRKELDCRDRQFTQVKENKRLIGSHSLEAWGVRLGFPKEHIDKEVMLAGLSEKLIRYCVRDVDLLEKLYELLVTKRNYCEAASTIEHKIHHMMLQTEYHGFPFDVEKAQILASHLEDQVEPLEEALKLNFEMNVTVLKTKNKLSYFNPRSPKQRIARLEVRGWEPNEYTKKGNPKIDWDSMKPLAEKMPEVQLMLDYLMLDKRLAQVKTGGEAWLKHVGEDERIHGRFIHIGAINNRLSMSKPNLAQVPRVSSPYGPECRELFTADGALGLHYPDVKMLGVDAKGLEMRTFGNRMAVWDGGEMIEQILNGDPHTHMFDIANQALEDSKFPERLLDRDNAKTLRYAFNYGAGPGRLGKICGVQGEGRRVKAGKVVKAAILRECPGLAKLLKWVATTIKRYGCLPAIDGRMLYIRSPHSALNTLLAGDGIILVKWAMCIWERMLNDDGFVWGEDYAILSQAHDEWQSAVRSEKAEHAGILAKDAMLAAGVALKTRIPIEGDVKFGRTWAETH